MKNLHVLLMVSLLTCAGGVAIAQDLDAGLKAAQAGDFQTALKEWKPLADQGHAYAQYNLGIMYANGYGVPEDDAEAVRWYRLAADQGHAGAQYNLGLKYANGEGVLQDNVTAHMWFNIAGANGDEDGRDNREKIEWKMTPADISEAQKRARIYMASIEIALTTVTLERDALLARVESSDADSQSASARLASAQEALAVALAEADALRAGLGDEDELRKLLASALAAKLAAEQQSDSQMTAAEQRDVLLATAKAALSREEALSAEGLRKVALLNEQIAAVRAQLGSLASILDAADARHEDSQVEITNLSARLNAALARVASEERRRARLEEAERIRLEEEAWQLARYRSEFFGEIREILGDREGVRIVGDRFVFSSEVLFESASTKLADGGKAQIERVVQILDDVAGAIPPEIDWVIRVDGHTDTTALSGTGRYRDNWELSQARALSVVRYMTEELGFPATRLAATGFGEFQPVALGDSPEALAQNRRIELKLTER